MKARWKLVFVIGAIVGALILTLNITLTLISNTTQFGFISSLTGSTEISIEETPLEFKIYKDELLRFKQRYESIKLLSCKEFNVLNDDEEEEEQEWQATGSQQFTKLNPLYPVAIGDEMVVLENKEVIGSGESYPDPQVSVYCSHKLSGPFVRRNPLTFSSLEPTCKPFPLFERANQHLSWCQPDYQPPNRTDLIDTRYDNTKYPFATDVYVYKVVNASLFQDVIFTKKYKYFPIYHDSVVPFLHREMGNQVMKDIDIGKTHNLTWKHDDAHHDIFHRLKIITHLWKGEPPQLPMNDVKHVKKLVFTWNPWDTHPFHGMMAFSHVLMMKQQIVEDPDMYVRVPAKLDFFSYMFNLSGIPSNKFLYGYYDEANGLCCKRTVLVDELYVVNEYPAKVLQQPHLDAIKMLKDLACKNVKPIGYLWEDTKRPMRIGVLHSASSSFRQILDVEPIRKYCQLHNITLVEMDDNPLTLESVPALIEQLASFDMVISTPVPQTAFSFCSKAGTHFISVMTIPDMLMHHYTTAQGMFFWPIVSSVAAGKRFPAKFELTQSEWDEIIKIIETVNTRRY